MRYAILTISGVIAMSAATISANSPRMWRPTKSELLRDQTGGRIIHERPDRKPPIPNPKTPNQILTDFTWGVQQMRMQEAPGLRGLLRLATA